MPVKLNGAGEAHLKSLIDAGKYNTDQAWDFSSEDGDKLLGDIGDDWKRYSSVHLGENTDATEDTKAHWNYPAAKAKGDGEEVYRSGLEAARKRAAGQGEKEIEDAAGRLVDLIDKKEGKDTETPAEDKNEPAYQEGSKVSAPRQSAIRDLPRLMTRIFGTPLLIAPEKLEVILAALGPRLGLSASPLSSDRQADAFAAVFGIDDGDGGEPAPYDLTPDGVAVICIDGTLVYKSSWLGALSGLTSYGDVRSSLDAAVADPAVKGILIQIDSYGGEVNGCFDLSDAIFGARAQKPIYAVAADDAYSAGFALLSSASKVFVSRTSGVGSVGVVALHVDQSAADKMEGLKYTYIYSGDHKIDGNPHAPLSTPALEAIQAESDRLRAMFAASVARYRGLSVDDVLATQAACFHGELAVAAKFADAVGTPDDALAALRAEIAGKSVTAAAAAPAMSAEVPAKPMAAAAQPVEAPKVDVVNLDQVREQVRGDTAALHVEIVELCALAKQPALAAEFIRSRMSVADVRKRLQQNRADVSDARETQGHIMPDADGQDTQTAAAGWDKAFGQFAGRAKGA